MSLSVIQRILVGFGGLLILLLVIAVAGFKGVERVSEGLQQATGNVASINKTSNQISESIAKADTTVLQYLLSRSPNSLTELKNSFDASKKTIDSLSQKILQQAQGYPSITSLLKQSTEQSKSFYQYTNLAFKNHERMLSLEASIPGKKFDLKDDISYLIDNLEMLKEDNEGNQKGFAADYLQKQFSGLKATISDYFDASKLTDLAQLKETMSVTLKRLKDNLTYLNDPDVNESVAYVRKEILDKDSVIENYYEYISLDQDSEVFANKLVSNMDKISSLSKQTIAKTEALRKEAKQEAQDAAHLSKLVMGLVVLISVLIAIVITLWVSRSIRKPLAHVMLVLGKIADGDFTQRSEVTSKDEFGELSRWVNQLVIKLQSVMKDIDHAASDVSDSAAKNVRLASETKGLMNAQSDKTSSIASAMMQMTSTVNEVAKNAEVTLSQVREADGLAGESHTKMDINVQQVELLVAQLEASSGVVNELHDHSQNIGKILEVIQDIAEQTNLLALNAAIEAARAGEQGRGFAVVADEVRSLATRTHASTEEIQRVIDLLQGGVSRTVSAMKDSQEKAYASVEETRVVGEALSSLQNRMATIRDLSTQIATAAEEQSHVAQEINGSIQEITQMSEEATQSADLSEKDSEQLFGLSSNQKALLAQFKIVP